VWRVCGGAVVAIAGIVALIAAASHHPEVHHAPLPDFGGKHVLGTLTLTSAGSGWSQTAYDLIRIGGWALVILGALTLIVGIVRDRKRPRRHV
jgi:hypothetical protein